MKNINHLSYQLDKLGSFPALELCCYFDIALGDLVHNKGVLLICQIDVEINYKNYPEQFFDEN